MKKYEMTSDKLILGDHTLYRVRALLTFGRITEGDIGGYIESEDNLSHKGLCWVFDDAKVYGNALVRGNAEVYDEAEVYGDAIVQDNASICRKACIYDTTFVQGEAFIGDRSRIFGNAVIDGNASIHDANVSGGVVSGDTMISGYNQRDDF